MANTPLGTEVRMPSEKDRENAIVAFGSFTSIAGTEVLTMTLDNDYPPINMGLQSPILGIAFIEAEVAATDVCWAGIPTNKMATLAPDTQGEFLVTAGRTINFYHTNDVNGIAIVSYIPKGSSQNV